MSTLWGEGYALLGNAGEFLDPVFSSGVTIAVKSASMAAALLQRQFAGETVDWQADYGEPLRKGVNTFRAFVESWYAGGFQTHYLSSGTSSLKSPHDCGDPRRLCMGSDQSVCERDDASSCCAWRHYARLFDAPAWRRSFLAAYF
jgi:hypothetical protein